MVVASSQELKGWQMAMDPVRGCYAVSKTPPGGEKYGLTSQLARAALSLPAKVAAGKVRQPSKEFFQHLAIASDSLAEPEPYLLPASRLDHLAKQAVSVLREQTSEISMMINGLRRSLLPGQRPGKTMDKQNCQQSKWWKESFGTCKPPLITAHRSLAPNPSSLTTSP